MLETLNDFDIWVYQSPFYVNVKNNKITKTISKDFQYVYKREDYNTFRMTLLKKLDENRLLIASGILSVTPSHPYQSSSFIMQTYSKKFQYCHTYIIDKNKNVLEQYHYNDENNEHSNYIVTYDIVNLNFLEIVKDFFGATFFNVGNHPIEVNDSESFNSFLNYKEPVLPTNKNQKIIQKLKSKFKSIRSVPKDIKESKFESFTTLDCSDDENHTVCFRCFAINKDRNRIFETSRIYITDEKCFYAKNTYQHGFINTTSTDISLWENSPLLKLDMQAEKNKKIQYIFKDILSFPKEYQGTLLFWFLKEPLAEQLYKAGYKNIINHILLEIPRYSFKKRMTIFLGHINFKEKNIYKSLGLNRYQLTRLNEDFSYTESLMSADGIIDTPICPISNIRYIYTIKTNLDEENINYLDNDSFDVLHELMTLKHDSTQQEIFRIYILCFGLKSLIAKKKLILDITLCQNDFASCRESNIHFRDFLSIYNRMRDNSIKFDFKNSEELIIAHNNIVELYNIRKDKYDVDSFQKNEKKLNKYVYENEKFAIIVPEVPEDLAIEGIALHHCVKSYVSKVCNGVTGILFLRNKEDIKTPFFTIEITKNKIQQIHGFANCNLDSNPQAESFINEWVKAKKIKISSSGYNKVR